MAMKMENNLANGPKRPRKLWLQVLMHLGLMAIIAIFIGWVAMIWLDSWTLHGDVVQVPQVRGLNYQEAAKRISDAGLTPVLSDSIYDSKSQPGAVLEQNPKENASVKPGREVYLTIHAFNPKMVTLPNLTDVSLRQARSALEGLGLTNIAIQQVPSEFQDLVLSVTSGGKPLGAGARIPITAAVTLQVGDTSLLSPSETGDSVAANDESELLDLY